jgi:hypothetical protein
MATAAAERERDTSFLAQFAARALFPHGDAARFGTMEAALGTGAYASAGADVRVEAGAARIEAGVLGAITEDAEIRAALAATLNRRQQDLLDALQRLSMTPRTTVDEREAQFSREREQDLEGDKNELNDQLARLQHQIVQLKTEASLQLQQLETATADKKTADERAEQQSETILRLEREKLELEQRGKPQVQQDAAAEALADRQKARTTDQQRREQERDTEREGNERAARGNAAETVAASALKMAEAIQETRGTEEETEEARDTVFDAIDQLLVDAGKTEREAAVKKIPAAQRKALLARAAETRARATQMQTDAIDMTALSPGDQSDVRRRLAVVRFSSNMLEVESARLLRRLHADDTLWTKGQKPDLDGVTAMLSVAVLNARLHETLETWKSFAGERAEKFRVATDLLRGKDVPRERTVSSVSAMLDETLNLLAESESPATRIFNAVGRTATAYANAVLALLLANLGLERIAQGKDEAGGKDDFDNTVTLLTAEDVINPLDNLNKALKRSQARRRGAQEHLPELAVGAATDTDVDGNGDTGMLSAVASEMQL